MSTTTPASTNPPSSRPADATPLTRRQLLIAAGASFAGIGIPSAALAAYWRDHDAEAAVAILGAGRRLGLYVSDGPARFLLAIGADGQAMLNALAAARSITSRRIDIALLAGTASDLPAHTAAEAELEIRTLLLLDNGAGVGRQLIRRPNGLLGSTRHIQLGNRVGITIEVGPPVDREQRAWRIVVDLAGSRVVYLPNMTGTERLPSPGPVAAVVAGAKSLAAGLELAPRLICTPDDVERFEIEEAAALAGRTPAWMQRVAAHDAARLRLADGGLELPKGAVALTAATNPDASPTPS